MAVERETVTKGTDNLVTATLVICALTITALLARRELFLSTAVIARSEQRAVFLRAWRDYVSKGVRLGATAAQTFILFTETIGCDS